MGALRSELSLQHLASLKLASQVLSLQGKMSVAIGARAARPSQGRGSAFCPATQQASSGSEYVVGAVRVWGLGAFNALSSPLLPEVDLATI